MMKFHDTPMAVRDAMDDLIDRLNHNGEYCLDNHRYAPENDLDAMSAYDEAVQNGCCGSVDLTVEVDGVTWHYGLNYGH